ncbi:uncharacterized protein LOC130665169 [Microplitis mediator]|uniref:uncharacterized protein LOC130665169 n=1 Tax=Microplitis mediator TaxID=375433 RepID=UPI002552F752|nr:uncharacterized protein LOC130665169 [Microplitis mediator]
MRVSKFLLLLMTILMNKPAIEAQRPLAKGMSPDVMRELSSVLRNKPSKESLREPPRLPPKNPLNEEQRAPPRLPPRYPLEEEQRAPPRLPPRYPLNEERRAPPRLPPRRPLNEPQRAPPRVPPKEPLRIPSREQSREFSKVPPSIYIKDAGFMVAIFEKNDHGTFFAGQGVLVEEGSRVLTSSLTIYSGLTLYVRAYNWPKNVHRNEKQKAFPSDYIERKVKRINVLQDYKIMQILDLAEAFPIEVDSISYLHTSVKDFYQTGHKCALLALKDKSRDEYLDESDQILVIKQRKIGSDQLFRPGSCETQLMSSLREENMNRFDKRVWFCGEEIGRKRCHRYQGGAALVCESRDLPNKYFLAGVQVDQDKCEVLFQDTTKASDPIYAELAFGN